MAIQLKLIQRFIGSSNSFGYHGDFIDGKINGKVPQYVKVPNFDDFFPVTDMENTFYNRTELIEAPEIPSTVGNLYRTFYGCTHLKKGPKIILNNVWNLQYTFYNCEVLEGEMEINAQLNESYGSGGAYWTNCFTNAATNSQNGLRIYGVSNMIRKLNDANAYIKSSNSNITK